MENLKKIKKVLKRNQIVANLCYGYVKSKKYDRYYKCGRKQFIIKNLSKFYVEKNSTNKAEQVHRFFKKIDIVPVENDSFFYSIDCYKDIEGLHAVLENYTVDYNEIIKGSLNKIVTQLDGETKYSQDEKIVVDALVDYCLRCKENLKNSEKYSTQIENIESMFERPADHFSEALQRILFINQFLWQTNHMHNGLGHLDWILEDLYLSDLKKGIIDRNEAFKLIKDFCLALHEYYWYKSYMLMGDTGQIIILGGIDSNGDYKYNDLTFLFIEVMKELHLPDPKVLLRCSSKMPDELIKSALECIATGIGAPFLSNDDKVIPMLAQFGYESGDAINYVTAACWEPLIPNVSCDQNNVYSINFAKPLVDVLQNNEVFECSDFNDLVDKYFEALETYLNSVASKFEQFVFEEDPLYSLFSRSSRISKKDLLRGGAKYCNLGMTSVGMGTVVNSLTNIRKLVFVEQKYSLKEIIIACRNNYSENEKLQYLLKNNKPRYGDDSVEIIELTNQILKKASSVLGKHQTAGGGRFKFGLSSPNYIEDSKNIMATPDGRKNGDSFSVHISCDRSLPLTELLNFSTEIDYSDNRINGNVVDFVLSPTDLSSNMGKYLTIIKNALVGGIYQLQINVIDSKTLIEAKNNPEKFPNLIVRVWGFSAYFNDLPEDYKNLLIERVIESEKIA